MLLWYFVKISNHFLGRLLTPDWQIVLNNFKMLKNLVKVCVSERITV